MAFRLGGRGASYGPGGVRQLTPKNGGMSNVAQQRLDATVARANEQYLNAIFVDGVEFQLWNRSPRSGLPCTCSQHEDVLPMDDDDITETADLLVQKKRASGLLIRPVLRADLPDDRAVPDDFSLFDGQEGLDYVDRVVGPSMGVTDYGQAQADLDAINHSGAFSLLDTSEPNHCGICFGTGFTQGYRLHGGQRFVLDASGEHTFDVKGFDLQTHERPNLFASNVDADNSVVWSVEFPAYFSSFYEPRVFSNTNRIFVFAVEVKEEGSKTYELLTKNFVEKRKGRAYRATVRVRPLKTLEEADASTVLSFTHVDFVFQTSKWPLLQIPPLSESLDLRTADKIISTTLILPPSLTSLRREDVLFDHKYKALWKIIGTSDGMTARGQVFGWSADARTILKTDALHALRLILDPVTLDAYTGLVQLQNQHMRPKSLWRKRRRNHGV